MISSDIPSAFIVILGALGDLSHRKLIPALYHLSSRGMLGPQHLILGVDTKNNMDVKGFKALVQKTIEDTGPAAGDENIPDWCDCSLDYHHLSVRSTGGYTGLAAKIKDLEQEHGLTGNRVFYLAIPIDALIEAITGLGEAGLNQSNGWTRIVLEKPFGTDLISHRNLDSQVHKHFKEEQIYRIDHYLGICLLPQPA